MKTLCPSNPSILRGSVFSGSCPHIAVDFSEINKVPCGELQVK